MPETVEHPVAVRAMAFTRPSRWRHRPVRLVRYDAYWAGGRVDFDVNLSKLMYRGSPADFAAIEESVHDHCPEAGTGHWVGESGAVVAGPTQTEPNPTGNVRGTPSKYGVSHYESYKKSGSRWRVGFGATSLSLGLYLVIGPLSDGFAGFVGALCVIFGLSALAGLLPKKYQWW